MLYSVNAGETFECKKEKTRATPQVLLRSSQMVDDHGSLLLPLLLVIGLSSSNKSHAKGRGGRGNRDGGERNIASATVPTFAVPLAFPPSKRGQFLGPNGHGRCIYHLGEYW